MMWILVQQEIPTLCTETCAHLEPALALVIILQVAELASLAQLLPPCSPTVRNPAPDSSPSPRLRPLQLLLAACVRFSCCSRARLRHPLPLLLPFASASSCCSSIAPASAAARRFNDQLLLPIASASTATPRLRPLQLLLPDCVRFNCCSPDCVRFDCCSPIAYWIPAHAPGPNVLEHSSRSSRFSN